MNFSEFVGLDYHKTDPDVFWPAVVQKLGLDTVAEYIPFPMDVLYEAYLDDANFNTKRTPLSKWDTAAGAITHNSQPPTYKFNGGLYRLLLLNHITESSLGECVCVLKYAAAMLAQARLDADPALYPMQACDICWDSEGLARRLPTRVDIPKRLIAKYGPSRLNILTGVEGWLHTKFHCQTFGFVVEPTAGDPDSKIQSMQAYDIQWDTDDENTDLPTQVDIPSQVLAGYAPDDKSGMLDTISEWLSNEFGFCHFGFQVRPIPGATQN